MARTQQFPLPIAAGLNLADASGQVGPGELRRIEGLVVAGRGKIEPTLAHREISSVSGDVVGLWRFPFYSGATPIGGIAAVWDRSSAVDLYRVGTNGVIFSSSIAGWSCSERPVMRADVIGQKLFAAGRGAGTKLSLLFFDAATETVTDPQFDFDGDGVDSGHIFPQEIRQYNNFLFVSGFGEEDDEDRPEVIRYSYLNLQDDGQGSGDAGANPSSLNLFDQEDHVVLSERGSPVHVMLPARGKMVILTPRGLHHLWGYSRGTFRADQLASGPGTDAPRSAVLGADTVFWWAPELGPGFYTGSGREDIGYNINPRLPEVDQATLIGSHVPRARQVRWYWQHNDAGVVKMKRVCWNYQRREWEDEGLTPALFFCAGEISTTSTDVGSGFSSSADGPAGDPSSFVTGTITSTQVSGSWTNGDSAAGTETEVWLRGERVATLDPGVSSYTWKGLSPGTIYSGEIRHKRNGQYSGVLSYGFTTSGGGAGVAPPTNLSAVDAASSSSPGAFLAWHPGQSGVKYQVWRRLASGGSSAQVNTTAVDATSDRDAGVTAGEGYYYKVRAEHPTDPTNVSAFTAEVLVPLISPSEGGLE